MRTSGTWRWRCPRLALSNRVHIFVRPNFKEELTWFFTNILGCEAIVSSDAPGLRALIMAFRFSNGASLSVEFTEDALDEMQARRAAWLELKADDPSALKKQVLEAGMSELEYLGNDYFYFAAPGGQIMRIVSAGDP